MAVEVDAFGTHGAPASFEHDRDVDSRLEASGITVLRFTRRFIERRPIAVIARLAAVMAQR